MSKIRVAIYNGNLTPTTFVKLLAKNLNIDGFSIGLFGTSNKLFKFKKDGVMCIPSDTNSKLLYGILFFVRTLQMCFLKPLLLWRIFNILRSSNKELRIKLKQYLTWISLFLNKTDVLHIQWASHVELFEELLETTYFKTIVSLRGSLITVAPNINKDIDDLYKRTLSKVDVFHAVSKDLAKRALKYNVPPAKLNVIYGAVSENLLLAQQKNTIKSEKISLLAVGRINWVKGYPFLIDVCKQLKNRGVNFQLKIIAKGNVEELIYKINSYKLTKEVVLVNGLSHSKVLKEISSAHFMVISSIEEGIANVALEAMALRTPVITTNAGGMKEVITPEVTGFISENKYDIDEFTNLIMKAINTPQEKINEITENSFHMISENHIITKQVKAMSDLYKKVLQ